MVILSTETCIVIPFAEHENVIPSAENYIVIQIYKKLHCDPSAIQSSVEGIAMQSSVEGIAM